MLARLITSLSIVGSAASIVSIGVLFFDQNSSEYRTFALICGLVTLPLLAYSLFVPGNPMARNVGDKLGLYSPKPDFDPSTAILIQRGELRINDLGTFAVEFPEPFLTPPTVELIKVGGYRGRAHVSSETEHQFTVGVMSFESSFTVRWVARGTPMYHYKIDGRTQ